MKKSVVFAAAMLLAACGGPKIIPDRELAQIFHDIYLVNTYVSQNGVNTDSLKIYEPIFASYGYTSEDIQYTIGNFAKRKSARLSDDVVEIAAEMLRSESGVYHDRIDTRSAVRRIAREKFAERVYFDSLISVRRRGDTARLRVVIPDVRPGDYEVSFGYLVDSTDRNTPLRTESYLVDAGGRPSGTVSRRLERARHATSTSTLTADGNHRRLELVLGVYPSDLTSPNITIDSLSVTYYLPDEAAISRLERSLYGPAALDSLLAPVWAPVWNPLTDSHETHLVAPAADARRLPLR